ncbi:class I SAM-dependent methyltransferase [Marinobacter sp. CHS3-4]|uniref:class I SAM-dependent methyltransferase n=1 Tax=Marinobacter sp. CHS3-4 TaxID=3045174 RepID=UPI0024B4AC3F|nr:class I SAM-dependent methyltransferase [Marinobacter sp. CHS3-4]MDI9245860.1 class I SAM-dependent methyltransferase [Marinobacter sp. CHS3-4]
MSALPNSHEALLRNRHCLLGRLAILGISDPGLLTELPQGGLVMSEHAGLYERLASNASWTAAFGYGDSSLIREVADTIVIFVPKSRAELSMRLSLALGLVKSGGRLLLVGEKKEGIAGAVKQLRERLPQAEKIDSARHCQVWLADGVAPGAEFQVANWVTWHHVQSHGVRLDVAGLPGIFSDGELDAGTELLLDTLAEIPPVAGRILDFACGAGVIGAWLQGYQSLHSLPVTPVDGMDVQFQAVACARKTFDRAGANGTITASDGLAEVDAKYGAVVTNPPFHSGIRTDTSVAEAFFKEVRSVLQSGGELRVVANRFLPYEPLIRRYIGPAKVLAENTRFIVWSAIKR